MTILTVPLPDATPWPTLGPQVCDFIESYLVYGPGDIRGDPVTLSVEQRALIYRMYEVYPPGGRRAGRRRFKRVALSQRKGVGKTEFAAWIAACELHRDAPVRCDGFDANGQPVGVGVTDPYIPLVAVSEEQTEDLVYACLKTILEEGELADDFDIGFERIMRVGGDGKAAALATSPDSRDGARTSWQHFDETHRWTLPRQKRAYSVMMANIPKRRIADPWSLETTTAPEPGGGSIAEGTHIYAQMIRDGQVKEPSLFYFHRQASDKHDINDEAQVRKAVIEASGSAAEWSDIDAIMTHWRDPQTDRSYFNRVWTNRLVKSAEKAFDVTLWRELADVEHIVPDGTLIVLGFDGARFDDSTALIGTEVETGYQWVVGLWECPFGQKDWEVPQQKVDDVVRAAFKRWNVWRMYADPPYWETWISAWAGRYGEKRVIEWWTNKPKVLYAVRAFNTAIITGEISHSGDSNLERHIGNAYKGYVNTTDAEGQRLWRIYKERPHSPMKIDAAMGAVLSWECRGDAVTSGAQTQSVYEERGLLTI